MCNCRKNKRTVDPGAAAGQQLSDQQISQLVASAETIATRVEQGPITPSSNTATL
jgi:hypothetical protein